MTTQFTKALASLVAVLPESACTVRLGSVVYNGISSGLRKSREHDDFSTIDESSATVKILTEENKTAPLLIGTAVDFKEYGSSEYVPVRIKDRKFSGGVLSIDLTDEHE